MFTNDNLIYKYDITVSYLYCTISYDMYQDKKIDLSQELYFGLKTRGKYR